MEYVGQYVRQALWKVFQHAQTVYISHIAEHVLL